MHYYDTFDSFAGQWLVVADAENTVAICRVKSDEDLALQLAKRFPLATHGPLQPVLRDACKQLKAYFSGSLKALTFPVQDSGPAFHRQVRAVMATIPYGHTASYSQLAAMAGNPKAFRAAASACAQNALAIYYPCHRILHKDRSMSGYAYGTDVKQGLLDHEAKFSASMKAVS